MSATRFDIDATIRNGTKASESHRHIVNLEQRTHTSLDLESSR